MVLKRLRLGSRGSALAMWQANWIAARLATVLPDCAVEIVPIRTRGDDDTGSFWGLTEKGLFTSDIEAALLAGEVDLAAHSLKDLPVAASEGLVIAGIPLRHDSRDVLVSRDALPLMGLKSGARVGTSSPRRTSLLLSLRKDVAVIPIRGNVDTRVRLLDEGAYDAIVVAAAGLVRLGLDARIAEWFDARTFPPAPGQGALAVQVREGDTELLKAVAELDDPTARETANAERSLLRALGGGCAQPIGAHAWRSNEGLGLLGFVGSLDGRRVLRTEVRGEGPETLGARAAEQLLRAGARELLS